MEASGPTPLFRWKLRWRVALLHVAVATVLTGLLFFYISTMAVEWLLGGAEGSPFPRGSLVMLAGGFFSLYAAWWAVRELLTTPTADGLRRPYLFGFQVLPWTEVQRAGFWQRADGQVRARFWWPDRKPVEVNLTYFAIDTEVAIRTIVGRLPPWVRETL